MSLQWNVALYGAREHYSPVRALERHGELKTLYTEAWCRTGRSLLKRMGGSAGALANRYSPEIPPRKVVSFTLRTLLDQIGRSRRLDGSTEKTYLEFIREGRLFSARVNRHLFRKNVLAKDDLFFGCQSTCLETLDRLKDSGHFSLVYQFDPARIEQDLVEAERVKWPGWEQKSGRIPDEYFDRLSQEWAGASMVMTCSEWTREAIVAQGVPSEKVIAVPLCYEPSQTISISGQREHKKPGEPLTVLWLGTVTLRKGIPYFLEAARLLKDRNIRFLVAGPVAISEKAVASAGSNVTFMGRVLRGQAEAVYRSADVFVLPTVSDSFGLTQIEAMAQGLPVIATPRCGKVVTEGVDGFIVPVGDDKALAASIARLDDNRGLLPEMSANAIKKSKEFSLDNYARLLRNEVLKRKPELA